MLNWIKSKIDAKARDAATPDVGPAARQVRPARTVKEQGDDRLKAGSYAEAERCYRQVMESDAQYPAALINLGFVLREQGRIHDAREVLELAVRIATEDADSHYLLASILETTGPKGAEVSHLQKAIDLRPDFELARRQLIIALYKSGRTAEATKLCEESLAILPDSAELHFCRGNIHLQADERALAIASCERALALNPELLEAQQCLSQLLLDTGQREQPEAGIISAHRKLSEISNVSRRLHIGGQVRTEGWEVLDANPGPCVDHVGNAADLSAFADESFEQLYASHVLEHFDYQGHLLKTLKEWHRVLAPNGTLFVSVPDLDVLARLFLDRTLLTAQDRFLVMRMIFGGHIDKYDYHLVGLNEEFLTSYLHDAGFVGIRRVSEFRLFDDTSSLELKSTPISLNMIAMKAAGFLKG